MGWVPSSVLYRVLRHFPDGTDSPLIVERNLCEIRSASKRVIVHPMRPVMILLRLEVFATEGLAASIAAVGRDLILGVAFACLSATVTLAQFELSADDGVHRTIAIVPFVNISGAAQDEWMGIGIAESVAGDLSRSENLRVLDLGRVRVAFERAGIDIGGSEMAIDVWRELGTDLLVTGSYQRLGDRLRVTARFVSLDEGVVVRSATVDGMADEFFDLQDRVAMALSERRRQGITPVRAESSVDTSPDIPGTPTVGQLSAGGVFILPPGAPPAPVAPEVITRNESGQATVRAVRLTGEFSLDGDLTDSIYGTVPSMSGFVQMEPNAGEPATEETEAWVFFDEENVYVAARAWDSTPESNWLLNEMRRDSSYVLQNDGIGFSFDTFYDRRSSVVFDVTPIGGRMDGQVNNDGSYSREWNPIWDFRTGRFEGGWSFEASIPFKSLRYRQGSTQVWGFVMRRDVMWKNEMSYLIPLDPGLGRGGLLQASAWPAMVGLEAPESGNLLEIKPYVIGDVNSDFSLSQIGSTQTGGAAGLDVVKYGLTENLTADFTFNTDFAQVEADEQQVNLTRFSLFFPEKRDFFIENQGAFTFGSGGRRSRSGGSPDAPILFYSRRVGLSQGLEVPLRAGGRLTGRAGAYTIGMLNIQTGEEPAAGARSTNFSVMRVRRDFLRRSSIGAILTHRSVSTTSPVLGSNLVVGLDTALAFYDNLGINGYWAKTETTGVDGEDTSYSADLRYNGDRYGVAAEHLFIDKQFSPEAGFVRRDDMRKSFGSFRFSPRPRGLTSVRKFTWEGSYNYITDADGIVETREPEGRFNIEFENSDQFNLVHTRTYDFLKEPFRIEHDVTIPVGSYDFSNTGISYAFGSQRRVSGNLMFERGTFYGGTKTTLAIGGGGRCFACGGRVYLSPKLSLEPGVSLNWVDVPEGRFTTTLATTRSTYTMTPFMFVSALVQYNSSLNSLSTNIRLRWEYQPGSELFIVYNEQRDTLVPNRFTGLDNRALIVKLNRLFRF